MGSTLVFSDLSVELGGLRWLTKYTPKKVKLHMINPERTDG